MTLADIKHGKKAIIKNIDLSHPMSYRLLEIGFTPGQNVELIHKSLFNDPLAVAIRGTIIALRKSDAKCIEIDL